MKIQPNVVDANGNFSFGNVTVSSIQTGTGIKIDGVLEKNYNFPGTIKTVLGTARWWVPTPIRISSIIASISTAPIGSDLIASIKKNGTQVSTATITDGSNSSTASVTIDADTGDYLTIDVTQVGSTGAGADMVITFLYYRT